MIRSSSKAIRLTAMLLLALLLLSGCVGKNPMEGKWELDGSIFGIYDFISFEADGDFVWHRESNGSLIQRFSLDYTGTYTCTDETVTMSFSTGESFTFSYVIKDNELELEGPPEVEGIGLFPYENATHSIYTKAADPGAASDADVSPATESDFSIVEESTEYATEAGVEPDTK